MRPMTCLLAGSALALSFVLPADSHACGGCFHKEEEPQTEPLPGQEPETVSEAVMGNAIPGNNDVNFDWCDSCDGMFFDRGELAGINEKD